MLRYIIYIVAVFLIIDHVYTHWGPQIINSLASSFMGRKVTVVEDSPYKESIIDKLIKEVNNSVNKLRR